MMTAMDRDECPYEFVIGIDLGTTNSAVAYAKVGEDLPERATPRSIRLFPITQLVAPGQADQRQILPSFLYLPGPYELPEGALTLPWDSQRDYAVGEFAREQGAAVPGRLVSSAKSWLCHPGVDRSAAILPWGAPPQIPKVSPVDAAARYLGHIREAWNHAMARGRDAYRMEEQLIVLTVPASFDEVARELTVEAARRAGLERVVLVEEPLAAFYAWLSNHEQDWRGKMEAERVVLVCDVGGGTTDFTLVVTHSSDKGLRFDRLAVGDHLMLGGDNMDLTLARSIEVQLLGKPGELDSKRWHQLCHQCRQAKEILLSQDNRRQSVDVTVVGSGSRLIGNTLKGTLSLGEVNRLLLEGFFPPVSADQRPARAPRTGISEWGLPYVQDPAITRHLAAFWRQNEKLLRDELHRQPESLRPDYVLFNGGALTPEPVRRRILRVMASWFADSADSDWLPLELANPQPELAVAMGAAYYAMVRLGQGVRVGAGSPRAYYVAVAGAGKEGAEGPAKGGRPVVCLVPRGTEEGYERELERPAFEVLTNQPVTFQVVCSSTRLGDGLGDVVELAADESTQLPPIRTALRYGRKGIARKLPVRLAVRLNEVGTLELWCRSQAGPHRWQLQFDIRHQARDDAAETATETLDQDQIERAREVIFAVFRPGTENDRRRLPKLAKSLVEILELPKPRWSTALIRQLADTLLECKEGRCLTADHEARWLNLLGYCMRPGFGHPVDEWRIREIWKLFHPGVQFQRQMQCRLEWWIFWRRVAGGLKAGHQWHIYQQLAPSLSPAKAVKKRKGKKKSARKLTPQEQLEAWMTLANLERLPAETKAELGDMLMARLLAGKPRAQEWWALSRLGARIPFYGPLDRVVSREVATRWIERILDHPFDPAQLPWHTLVQLARFSGDRQRDLADEIRLRLRDLLKQSGNAERYLEQLENPHTVRREAEQTLIFGEALPSGLMLSEENSEG